MKATPRAWRPSETDITWAIAIITSARDGALMRFPAADLYYRVHKAEGILSLACGDAACETHQRTITVFRAIGFTVDVRRESRGELHREMLEHAQGKTAYFGPGGAEDMEALRAATQNN